MVLSVCVFKRWPSMHIFHTFLRTQEELQLWKHSSQNWKLGAAAAASDWQHLSVCAGLWYNFQTPYQEDEYAAPPLKQPFLAASLPSSSSFSLPSTHWEWGSVELSTPNFATFSEGSLQSSYTKACPPSTCLWSVSCTSLSEITAVNL